MYTEILKKKYKKPSPQFWQMVDNFVWDMDATHADYQFITMVLGAYKCGHKMSMRNFWDVRNAIGEYRDAKRLAYLCSPESETYWCS